MIAYQLERSRRAHSIRISIHPSGEVKVIAPRDCPTFFINNFVKKQEAWIEKHRAHVLAQRQHTVKNESEVTLFGKTYTKKIIFSQTEKIGVIVQGDEIVIHPVSQSEKSVEKALTNFFKSTAMKYILPRTEQLAKVMGIHFRNITLREQKTRWGSCSSQGNLNFNWRLVHSPPPVIDYVIIHELAHRKHMNHSKSFWSFVAEFDPEHLKHQGWLKRQGMALG